MMYEILRGCPMLFELLERFDEEARSPDPKALGVVRVVEWLMTMNDSGRFPLAAEVGLVRARVEAAAAAAAREPPEQGEGDIGPPPEGPSPIVGEPGWIPAAPSGKLTTTEAVATLQRRYPDDAELRRLVELVTEDRQRIAQLTARCGDLASAVAGLREQQSLGRLGPMCTVWAVYETDSRGMQTTKGKLHSVHEYEAPAIELGKNYRMVEARRAVRDEDGRLYMLDAEAKAPVNHRPGE